MTNTTKIKISTRLPILAFAIVSGIASTATAQSRLERHRDKLHRSVECAMVCDIDWATWEQRSSDFSVKVSFRGQPISDARVTLTSLDLLPDESDGGYVIAARVTNADGVAKFSAIPSGKYIAHVNQGLLAQSQDVAVAATHTSTGELLLEWPVAPIATRNVRGWLTAWQRSTPQNRSQRLPFSNVQVQLFDMRSGKLLGSTRTGADGYYEFPASEDGLYVVRVSEGQAPGMKGYDEAVEVASNAAGEYMPALVVDQVCGSGLEQLDERIQAQEPCVPPGAADPMPPTRYYDQYRYYNQYRIISNTVIIVQQQVIVIR